MEHPVTLRNGTAVVVLSLLVAVVAGLLLFARRRQARDFLDPKGPVFTCLLYTSDAADE